ncbi:MAG: mn transporter [Candidatus Berkelbacteria bacterium Licking1014_7]|uniref:Mn transporter n=1 Tax=Candidatus Berkelbacteria bacterium Licking1014_7 TaxID=2017147 RepID=A0A554LKS4_9BACT|nr:MAG: mn transporter [Candidatus Berkelbacteria bacterium Licking1014_7]
MIIGKKYMLSSKNKTSKNKIEKTAQPFLVKDIEKVIKYSLSFRLFHLSSAYKKRRSIRDFFRLAKSGTITGAADNDPAGIVTYTQVGAATGFSQLWLMLLSLPMLSVVEEMSARVGVVTKQGLNSVIRKNYGLKLALAVAMMVAVANILTIGADLAAISEVFEIMSGAPSALFVAAITFLIAYFLIRKNYKIISRYLFLITPIFLLYVASGILANPEWGEILRATITPTFSNDFNYWMLAVGLLGTTISPYLIFWQTTEEIEEHRGIRDLKKEAAGVWLGMTFAHLIFYFIIISSAAVFFGKGVVVETAGQAAIALEPAVGSWAMLFFGLGIIGSGILAVPVLAATAGYVIKDAMHWHGNLELKQSHARSFYAVIVSSLLVGLTIALSNINPVKALVYSQVLNGFLMPFLLVALLAVCNSRKILGKFVNNVWSNLVGIAAVVVLVVFDIILVFQYF